MNVLALVTDAYGGHGGIARYNRDFINALAECCLISRVSVLSRARPFVDEPLPDKVCFAAEPGGRLRYSLRAAQLAGRAGGIDLIFCGHLFMAPLAATLARRFGIPFWLQLHGIDAWDCPGRIVRWSAESAQLTTSVSRYTRDRFLGWAAVDPSTVRVLPNTFEPRFTPGAKPLGLITRHSLDGKRVLLTISRLASSERYKGHDRVIAALPEVIARCPEAVYLIVGDGDDRSRLEELAAQMGLSKSVIFAGRVADDEVPFYYRLADVFVMPSTGEGFGIVFLEAAAAGLPVVGGNRDGSVDALADGAIGTLVDPSDQQALVNALLERLEQGCGESRGLERFSVPAFRGHVAALVDTLRPHEFAYSRGGLRRLDHATWGL